MWDTEVPGDPLGGALVVGDLVLTATLQGEILAVDRRSGEGSARCGLPAA